MGTDQSSSVRLRSPVQIDRPGEGSGRGCSMRLPIDTSRLKFLVVAPAEPLRQYEEGKPREAWAPRTDASGEILWRAQLVALRDGEAESIRVVVPGRRQGAQGCRCRGAGVSKHVRAE